MKRSSFLYYCTSIVTMSLLNNGRIYGMDHMVINEIDPGVPDAVELYNGGSSAVNLYGWRLITGDDVRVQTFILPSFMLNAGEFVVLSEGSEPGTASIIYLGTSTAGYTNINWSNATPGGVELRDAGNIIIDYVRWANYGSMPTQLTHWTGGGPPLPPDGTNLGRDITSTDTNEGGDIFAQLGTLGRMNDSPPIFLSTTLAPAIVDLPYQCKINVVGPAGPFTYDILSGYLPDSLHIDGDGYIRGIPKVTGEFPFYLRVSDSQTPPRSALVSAQLNSYEVDVMFEKGILLVNGVSWSTYASYLNDSYSQKAFWGNNPIDFWDCFATPTLGYPPTLPSPRGHGAVPFDVLCEYSTVIWIGNNYNGDLDVWQQTPVFPYVKSGGDLLLLTRQGQSFIDEEFRQYLGIQWREEAENTIHECIATYPGLHNITINPYGSSGHTLVAVFSTSLTDLESTLVFKETASFSYERGLGVWKKPSAGGQYRSSGGQVVFISGRPYCMNAAELRGNVEFILGNFFNVTAVPAAEEIPRTFALLQNYPNPFNAHTTIAFTLARPEDVEVKIFNTLGEEVKTLLDKYLLEGSHEVGWDGSDQRGIPLPSGIYYLRLTSGDFCGTRKLLYLR